MGPSGRDNSAKRSLLRVLSGAVPRRDHHADHSAQDTLLHVQCDPSLYDAVGAHSASVLHSARFGREDSSRHHCSAGLLCVHVSHLGKVT